MLAAAGVLPMRAVVKRTIQSGPPGLIAACVVISSLLALIDSANFRSSISIPTFSASITMAQQARMWWNGCSPESESTSRPSIQSLKCRLIAPTYVVALILSMVQLRRPYFLAPPCSTLASPSSHDVVK